MANLDIIGLGALNMDHLYRVGRLLKDGETVVDEVVSNPGGSAANTVYGLARLGLKTGFAGAVGDDADGKAMLEDLRKAGVDTGRVTVKPGVISGSVLCLSDRQGRRSLYVAPGANGLMERNDLDLAYLNSGRFLHVSSFVGDRQFEMTREVVGGLTTRLSFSPGSLYVARGLEALSPLLKRSEVLFINGDELRHLTGKDVVRGAAVCLKLGCRIVAVTLGKGKEVASRTAVAYIRDAAGEYIVEPLTQNAAPVVDTTGAGDAFAAGFLYGFLNGKPLEICGQLGNLVAQFCVTKLGARPGLPTRAQMENRYRELYQKEL